MSSSAVVIRDVLRINEGERIEGDVLFSGGIIAGLGGTVRAPAGAEEIDGSGLWLLPGVIDDQVHFRDYSLAHKGTIASESRAAAAGGVTSVMEMPNTRPQTTSWNAWEEKNLVGLRDSVVNFAFYIGATNDNAEELLASVPLGNICGLKIFMGSSTGNMLVNDPGVLEYFFRDWPGLIATHCEDEATILRCLGEMKQRFPEGIPPEAHPLIRNHEACWKSSSMAVDLAKTHRTRLHVLHLTTAKEVGLFSPGKLSGKLITSEACVHHLTYCDGDYAALGFQIKCNPAIKTGEDRDALWRGIEEGRIDVIASDHAPHTWEEKQVDEYEKVPAGLPLIQHSLALMLAHAEAGRISVERVVELMSHHVAECYRIIDRGYLREGYRADAVLVDPERKQVVKKEDLLYHCGWTPLEGRRLGATIKRTFVNGATVYADGTIQCTDAGQPLKFTSLH